MVFKLVRTDTEDPYKTKLPVGTHLIGRGKLLDCDDKRVSRKHGELIVTDDAVSIKALHQNPCFYTKKGNPETHILKLNCSVELSHGDRFGLLPDTHWYELLHCSELDIERSPEKNNEENTEPLDGLDQTLSSPPTTTEPTTQPVRNGDSDNDEATNMSINPESPSVLPPAVTSPSFTPRDGSPVRQDDETPTLPPATATENNQSPVTDSPAPLNDGSPPQPKRCHSPAATEEPKKIKVEPEVKQEPVKQESDAQPGTSGDQGPSSTAAAPMPPSPAKPAPALGRERCMYGANCYRRNPQHKATFSHPADPDWGSGPRGLCPYGAGCRRRDPRHWRDHDHPPGVTPPPAHYVPEQKRPVKRVRSVSANSNNSSEENSDEETERNSIDSPRNSDDPDNSDAPRRNSDDSPEKSLIVTGKRRRKLINRPGYVGLDLDDENDKDPFGTDDEDEWVPDSQFTPDTQDD